jgi:hypothetical protein
MSEETSTAVGAQLERHVWHCWPKPWIEAAMRAGFAHYKGDGEWEFINDKMRDMLVAFAVSIAEHAEQEQREELAELMERQHALLTNTSAANLIRNA